MLAPVSPDIHRELECLWEAVYAVSDRLFDRIGEAQDDLSQRGPEFDDNTDRCCNRVRRAKDDFAAAQSVLLMLTTIMDKIDRHTLATAEQEEEAAA